MLFNIKKIKGTLQLHKWENCLTIDRQSWGFRRNAVLSDYNSTPDLLKEMATTVSCGGNMLLNVGNEIVFGQCYLTLNRKRRYRLKYIDLLSPGPTHYGQIPPIYEERLRQIGQWLNINGEAIYGSRPWIYQNDTRTPDIW
jgi:alpha-L-fucosidase